MAGIRLTLIGGPHEWVLPLFDGTVQPEGIELAVTRTPPPDAMRRQLSTWEFDVSEMAFGAYLVARAKGADIVAIPAFPMRGLFHTSFACHVGSGIDHPSKLVNKRVGIAEYVQTACLWARGILQHDFDMDPFQVKWYAERSGADSTGEVLGFKAPNGIDLTQIPGGQSLIASLLAHDLDAAQVGKIPSSSSGEGLEGKVRPLFPDVVAEGKRYFDKHGYIPANHIYVIRGEVLRKHDWISANLYRAFKQAKELSQRSLSDRIPACLMLGAEHVVRARKTFGEDPCSYGVTANRPMLETVVRFSQEQGLIKERPPVDLLFAPGIRD